MIRVLLFVVLAGVLAGYAYWIYTRVELAVAATRRLWVLRSCALAILLLLLFDPRIPIGALGGASPRWVLLDASLSMTATRVGAPSAWDGAAARAAALEREGWNVVRFGDGRLVPHDGAEPGGVQSRLAPALATAAESGAHEVRVLSDFRLEDPVALRAALATLPVAVTFERFGDVVANAGISRFDVEDLLQPEGRPDAEIEVHGGTPGDSITVEILEEGRLVATARIRAPSPGLRASATVELPTPSAAGRVRYEARISAAEDAFAPDDRAVAYAAVGHEEGALVLVSVRPDWEPRYLLPVLEEVTGLPTAGFLRVGPDRFVRLGRAIDRGRPADSATVRRAASEASVLVVHGLGADTDGWLSELATLPGRRLLLPADAAGAARAGLDVSAPRAGEWYASPDIPTSPVAGALAGISLGGLPPLTSVLVPTTEVAQPPLQLQLRGAGPPQSAFALLDRETGRVVVALASGTWRWAARDAGREPYRRLWSGVTGWLLSDRRVLAAEPRPESWVVRRGRPVRWALPGEGGTYRIVVGNDDAVVADTTVSGPEATLGVLTPGGYTYSVLDPAGDTLGAGRFDVGEATSEMLFAPEVPEASARSTAALRAAEDPGLPVRTTPWPYLLVIGLLCSEWVVRRRSGLR